MGALEEARDHYASRFERFAETLGPEGPWLAELRREALARFLEQGLPHTKLEEWRYTNLSALAKQRFELAQGAPGPAREDVEAVSFPVFACGLFVFVNGRFVPELSAPEALTGEVRVESLAALRTSEPERLEPHLGSLVAVKEHPFAALNTAFLDDGAVLRIPRGLSLEQPVHLVFVDGPKPCVRHPRVLVVAEESSRAVVIQDHVSLGETGGFTNAVTEIHAARNAQLDHVLLQREDDATYHVSNLQVRQERDARVAAHTLTFGGALVRNDAGVLLADEGAECRLHGLFVGRGRQVLDNHTLVDHAMPHCTSRELYKGILGDQARGVFRGRVVVRPDAQKSDATQYNPNLLLSDGAEIDTKPQLEIFADDVKCSHGSTIGQLDPDALFYLRSRGLDEPLARGLLTRGFGIQILDALPLRPLAEDLGELLLARLAGGAGSEGKKGDTA